MANVGCLFLETKLESEHLFHGENLLCAETAAQEGDCPVPPLEKHTHPLILFPRHHMRSDQQHYQMDRTLQHLHLPHIQMRMCWMLLDFLLLMACFYQSKFHELD